MLSFPQPLGTPRGLQRPAAHPQPPGEGTAVLAEQGRNSYSSLLSWGSRVSTGLLTDSPLQGSCLPALQDMTCLPWQSRTFTSLRNS